MPNPSVVTAPAHAAVTMDEVKEQLGIATSDTDRDSEVWGILVAAQRKCENETQRKLVTQTLDYTVDCFPRKDFIVLPGGVLQSITSLKYTDADGVETTWAATNYFANTTVEPGRLVREDASIWPTATLKPQAGIVIRYIVGYGTGDQVPDHIRHGILLYAEFLDTGCEKAARAAMNLWSSYRLFSFGQQAGTAAA